MKKYGLFVIGLFMGTLLCGGAAYAASGVLAERSTQSVCVDGQRAELGAYIIDGENYVRLRDVGQALDVNVYWDGASVQIDTAAAYTGAGPVIAQPEESIAVEITDPSAAVNPEVFTGLYTREAYNGVYSVIHALRAGDENATAVIPISAEECCHFETMLSDYFNGHTLTMRGAGYDLYEVYVAKPDRAVADQYLVEFVAQVNALPTDREKVIAINDYLCEKVTYAAGHFFTLNDLATATGPIYGNCAAFSIAFNELCGRTGVISVRVHGEHHYWNCVYVDDAWSFVDASANANAGENFLLLSPTHPTQIRDMEGFCFLRELLVPGSTK